MAETTKPNLYQKLLGITEEVGKIDKTGKNTMQNYAFTEYSQVVAEIRVPLAKYGVMIIPETVSRTTERFPNAKGTITVHANVAMRFTLINADNPDERIVCEWDAGESLDTSDKATNKAITASHKSFLMKLFNISDKDDPDAHSPETPNKGINYDKSPEEPSRKVGDEPISNISKQKVREAFAKAKIGGVDVTAYCYDHIAKEAPTTEADADKLIKSLEVPF